MNTSFGRRSLLRGLGLSGVAALGLGRANAQSSAVPPAGRCERENWWDLGLTDDPVQESQFLHVLAATYMQQADTGEALDTALRIQSGDPWSWPNEWVKTADRVRAMAEASLRRRHSISAGQALLRAANYYRAALLHHPDPASPNVLEIGRSAVAAYDRALALLDLPARKVRIPYENTTLLGYFFRSPRARGPAPCLIMHQGRDAWPEESKYIIDDCLLRGYHCLIFHGPGQGMAIREQGLAFRSDWENVVSPVVDFAHCIHGVDPRRLALMGLSMGGALAPRAAAFEHRLKILIANPGVLNWYAQTYAQFEGYFPGIMPLSESDPAAFDRELYRLMSQVALYDWYMRDAMNKHGARTPSEYLRELKAFDNTPVAAQIQCRTLVMDGDAEAWSVGQAKQLFDALQCPKDYMLFTAQDTGLLHCQEGAPAVANHRMFDWLDEYL